MNPISFGNTLPENDHIPYASRFKRALKQIHRLEALMIQFVCN